ncbi:non-specific serine/threonine protein kinase [Ranunculus cassubicifolius]
MKMRRNPWILLCFTLLLVFSSLQFCNGGNNITAGQSISGNQTIVSEGRIFELGFFTTGNTYYYLGIWYRNIPEKTVVWMANRDTSFGDPADLIFGLSEHGYMFITHTEYEYTGEYIDEGRVKHKYNYSVSDQGYHGVVVLLLDDGNLILKASENSSIIVWQSFDHPTDTWLPGAKFTNKSSIINSVGSFYLYSDTDAAALLFYRRLSYNYTTWFWEGNDFGLESRPLMEFIKFSYDDKGKYFSYSVNKKSVPTRLVIGELGIQLLTWSESFHKWKSISFDTRFCGINSWKPYGARSCKCLPGYHSEGTSNSLSECVLKKELDCSHHRNHHHKFYVMRNIRMVESSVRRSFARLQVTTSTECELMCLAECSCRGYFYSNVCFLSYGYLPNIRQVSPSDPTGQTLHIRYTMKHHHINKTGRVLMIVAVTCVLTFLSIVLVAIWIRKKNVVNSPSDLPFLVSYGYRDLQKATNNFSEELGKGGFGSVFRGTVCGSTSVAVKKLYCFAGEKQFRAEVSTIGMIQHLNLVRLRGFCAEGTKRLLVYDYMPNGSLNTYLFARDSLILEWKTRYQIAIGIARGLEYLHEKCKDCIIHCDIKPENILLDAGFNPLVADFGLAKLLGRDFSRVLTTMRGTRGYLAPEWISGVPITPKADVYSYGMMLFEIISGRRNLEMDDDDMVDYFPAKVADKLDEGEEVLSLLDPTLEGNAEIEELVTACRVACWCIQGDEKNRPSMGDIVQGLEGIMEVDIPPVPSFIQVILRDPGSAKSFSHLSAGVGSSISVSLQNESINSSISSIVPVDMEIGSTIT